jgi:ATP-dependent Clp protease adapter protein ClpS
MIYLLVLPEASAYIVARGAMHAFTMSVQSADVKKFSVYLQKDDHLMREYVSRVLMMVCEISSSEALAILMKANRDYKNRALCGAWEEQLAKHIHTCLESAGLSVVITPFSGPNAGLLASEPIEVEDAIAVMPREAQAPSPEAPPNAFELEDEADAAARKWALELEQDMEEERRAAQAEKVSAEEAVQKRSFLRRSWGWLTRQGVPDPKRWAAEKAQAEREQAENEKAKVVTAPKDDASWFRAGKSLSQSSSEDFQSLSPFSAGVASDAPTPKPFGLTPVEVIMDMRRKAAEEQAENEKLEGEGEVEAVKKRPV